MQADLRWDDLSLLLAVHRGGTLAGAADRLGVDPSTVSRRLRACEDSLGARLFDRTPDGLVATELAERLLPHAERAEAAVMAATAEAAGTDSRLEGTVRLALAEGMAAYGVCPRLPDFRRRYPQVQLELVTGTGLVDLTRREADIALRFVRPTRGDLVARRVAGIGPYVAVSTHAYLEQHPRDEPLCWIGWVPEKMHLPEGQLYQRTVDRPPTIACTDMVTMVEALRAGSGAMLLPQVLAGAIPGLVVLPEITVAPFEASVWLVTHRALREVPRVHAVWTWLEELVLAMPGEVS